MTLLTGIRGAAIVALALTAGAGAASGAARQIAGVACTAPPPAHCPDGACPSEVIAVRGNAVEPRTGRQFFLDYPCNLKPNEKVTVVLSLHGGGSSGNWQRHYFPIMDLKEKYRLVIATPTGTNAGWNPASDDAYLKNIVELVYDSVGRDKVKAFWLAGHSLGGQTSNRLIMTDPFYREKLTGWVSLSGGRLGSKRADVRAAIPAQAGRAGPPATQTGPAAGRGGPPGGAPELVADASILPNFDFSHIYSTGEHELTAAGLPGNSPWAEKLRCGAQGRPRQVVDVKAGYVGDSRPQANPNKIWGLAPRPGPAKVYRYPGCRAGHVVADVVRLDKGHTEGLEPKITEEIVSLMMAAR